MQPDIALAIGESARFDAAGFAAACLRDAAGAGKSTLARRLAAELGYIYVDTGAMYRAIGLYALRAGKDPKDNAAVDALLPEIELRLASIAGEQHIYLKDEDVSTAIRTEAAGMAASAVGANPAVRAFLLDLQRSMAKKQDVLMDGRDIGTVVLPDATVKIFLTASPEARATRRWKEYQAKGIDTPYEEVLADVKQRDYQDTHRAAAPRAAERAGIPRIEFVAAFDSQAMQAATEVDFNWVQDLGIAGFPTLLAERRGQLALLTNGYQPLQALAPLLGRWLEQAAHA